jgi:fibronectin-binding autotransporter adhesin
MGLNNSYTGNTTVNSGTLQLNAGGGGPPATNPLTLKGTLDLNGFSAYVGGLMDGGSSTGVITNSAAGANTLSIVSPGGPSTFSGVIQNGGPGKTVNIALSGSTNLTLSGANSYGTVGVVGTTVGSFTTLKVNNASGSGTGVSDVAVNGTLGGNGTISGNVTIANGAILAPGNSVGTLTVGGLTLPSGSILNYEFNASPANDQTIVSGANGLTINGGGFNLYAEGTTTAWSTAGSYTLLSYSGVVQGTGVSAMSILNKQANRNYVLSDNTSLHAIQLTINNASAWTGASSNTWAISGNWTNGVPGATNSTTNTDAVIFNANPANPAPIVDASRNVQSITFETSSVGAITLGGSSLLLTSGGTIQTTATVNQPEAVSAALVIEGANGAYTFTSGGNAALSILGGITGAAAGSTVLTLNGANTSDNYFNGIIGNGSATSLALVKNGAGSWRLNGTNTFTGGVSLNAGTLFVSNNSALGTGTLTVNGGTLGSNGNSPPTLSNSVNLVGTLSITGP